eukprot:14274299-Alexandrium_andersonii.AAC.1
MPNSPRASIAGGRCEVPEAGMDYCVLVLKDRDSLAIMAHPALCKGRLRSGAIEQAANSIRRLGCR